MNRKIKLLTKLASIIKKADPPHKGYNSDNPLVRHIEHVYGRIPKPDDKDFANAFRKALIKARSLGYGEDSPAILDYCRVAGLPTHYNADGPSGSTVKTKRIGGKLYIRTSPETSFITLGPGSSEKVLRHELGHHFDFKQYPWRRFYSVMTSKRKLPAEIMAWNNALVPPGDPTREAALATYKARTKKQLRKAMTEYNRHLGSNFDYVSKYTGFGVPIIYDYASAKQNYPYLIDRGREVDGDLDRMREVVLKALPKSRKLFLD